MRKSLLSMFLLLLTGAVIVATPTPAHAGYAVQVYDDGVLQGGITTIVIGNSLLFSGSTTHFSITNGSGSSNNPGTITNGQLALSSNEQISTTFGSTGGTHTIQIVLSQTDFTSPTSAQLSLSSSAGGSFTYGLGTNTTASQTVSSTYQGFLDTSNTLFGQPGAGATPIQNATATGTAVGTLPLVFIPGTSINPNVAGGTPFSMTDVLGFTFTIGAGSGQATANVSASTTATAVPEPASMLLLGSGLLGLARFTRKRRS